MLTKRKLMSMALTLSKAGDANLPSQEGVLDSRDLPNDQNEKVIEICRIVNLLCSEYRFEESPLFAKSVLGKSEELVRAKIRFEGAPLKRKERLEKLYESFRSLASGGAGIDDLIADDKASLVARLRILFSSLRLPD
jgi:hypothetical protein